jgi:prepilin-type N-terminal cleavage/methylation domain-containing protein
MKGFSVIEILVVVAIIAIISGIVLTSFSSLNKNQALLTETDTILSMLDRARNRSVSSESATEYGLHFASSSVVLFVGKTYPAGSSTNETENINSRLTVSSINLTGGASDLYFKRISGKASATGTVVLSIAGGGQSKTITIYNTGLSDAR